MKLAVIALLFAQAMAFAPSRPLMARPAIALFGRVDSSEMIEAALAASKEFGPTSKEARVAWDQVEEMDASDNRCVLRAYERKNRLALRIAVTLTLRYRLISSLQRELNGFEKARRCCCLVRLCVNPPTQQQEL